MTTDNPVHSCGACNKALRKQSPDQIGLGFFISAMATKALKPCSHPSCGVLVAEGSRCKDHVIVRSGSFSDSYRGNRHDRGYGNNWTKARLRILQRDAGLCQICLSKGIVNHCAGKKFGAHVDHIIPKFEGGTDRDENLQTLCAPCHKEKTAAESARASKRL